MEELLRHVTGYRHTSRQQEISPHCRLRDRLARLETDSTRHILRRQLHVKMSVLALKVPVPRIRSANCDLNTSMSEFELHSELLVGTVTFEPGSKSRAERLDVTGQRV